MRSNAAILIPADEDNEATIQAIKSLTHNLCIPTADEFDWIISAPTSAPLPRAFVDKGVTVPVQSVIVPPSQTPGENLFNSLDATFEIWSQADWLLISGADAPLTSFRTTIDKHGNLALANFLSMVDMMRDESIALGVAEGGPVKPFAKYEFPNYDMQVPTRLKFMLIRSPAAYVKYLLNTETLPRVTWAPELFVWLHMMHAGLRTALFEGQELWRQQLEFHSRGDVTTMPNSAWDQCRDMFAQPYSGKLKYPELQYSPRKQVA